MLSAEVVLNLRGKSPVGYGKFVCVSSFSFLFCFVWGLTRLYSEGGIWVHLSAVDWPRRDLKLTSFTDEAVSLFKNRSNCS
jgi:hypothetical protein